MHKHKKYNEKISVENPIRTGLVHLKHKTYTIPLTPHEFGLDRYNGSRPRGFVYHAAVFHLEFLR